MIREITSAFWTFEFIASVSNTKLDSAAVTVGSTAAVRAPRVTLTCVCVLDVKHWNGEVEI